MATPEQIEGIYRFSDWGAVIAPAIRLAEWSVSFFADGQPVPTDQVALAGPDGRRAAELLGDAKRRGSEVLNHLARRAITRIANSPDPAAAIESADSLLDADERAALADALAAVTATANLLGRSRVRERAHQADLRHTQHVEFAESDSFQAFVDPPPPVPPTRAIDYFRSLVPGIAVDPATFGPQIYQQAFTLAATADQALLQRVKDLILGALETGQSPGTPQRVEDVLRGAGVLPSNPQYSEMVFRTNMMGAYNRGAMEELQSPGMDEYFPVFQYSGVTDGRQRHRHEVHFGKYFPSSVAFEDVRDSELGSYDGFNCRCVLPGQRVQGHVIGASKAFYSGEVVEISTANGCTLSITSNHPVLAASGLIPAGMLKEGDDLVCYNVDAKIVSPDNEKDAPPLIEDVFQSLAIANGGTASTPVLGLDFHGDAESIQGNVEIVCPNRNLLRCLNSGGVQRSDNECLLGRYVGEPFVTCNSAAGFSLETVRLAFVGNNDSLCPPPAIVGAHALCPSPNSFIEASESNASLSQPRLDCVTINSVDFPNRGGGLPAGITFDKIIRVRKQFRSTHVYDLQTVQGLYVVGNCDYNTKRGIIVSNCTFIPVDKFTWAELQSKGAKVEAGW